MVRVRKQKDVSQPAARAAPLAKFAIMIRHKGKEKATDLPFPSSAIEVLALAGLVGQALVAAINKREILC